MALISGSLPPQTCYGTPQQMLDLFAQYLSSPTQNIIIDSPPYTISGDIPSIGYLDKAYGAAGASQGDIVVVSPGGSFSTQNVWLSGTVTSANTVTIRAQATGALSLSTISFRFKVLKF